MAVFLRGQHGHAAGFAHQIERNDGLQRAALRLRNLQFFQQGCIAQRQRGPGFFNDFAQFLGAQQRHRRHGHQPGLHHGQPAQRHADGVAAAQQHAVTRHQLEVLRQHLRNSVDAVQRFGVSQRDPVRAQHRPVGMTGLESACEQRLDQIGLRWNVQLGQT